MKVRLCDPVGIPTKPLRIARAGAVSYNRALRSRLIYR
jgi:hypothetical protein